MYSFKTLLLPAALAAALLTPGSPTHARERAGDPPSLRVRYADLNLQTEAGIARLHRRLRNAAESVCQPLESRVLGLNTAYDRCVTDSMTRAIAAVGSARLEQYHVRRSTEGYKGSS